MKLLNDFFYRKVNLNRFRTTLRDEMNFNDISFSQKVMLAFHKTQILCEYFHESSNFNALKKLFQSTETILKF